MLHQIEQMINEIRETKPLILNLTNFVTMELMANSLLALGAAPLMSVCDEELFELIQIARAININIGTLDPEFISRAQRALSYAKQLKKPVIFDPVGSGATKIRTQTARSLFPQARIIRGNASEIISLYDDQENTLGVESLSSTAQAEESACLLAEEYGLSVIVSGPMDFITNGTEKISFNYGSPLMALVTGMGCTLTAITAAFHAVTNDAYKAATAATLYFSLCGTLAAQKTKLPGHFKQAFIDTLYQADFESMREYHVE